MSDAFDGLMSYLKTYRAQAKKFQKAKRTRSTFPTDKKGQPAVAADRKRALTPDVAGQFDVQLFQAIDAVEAAIDKETARADKETDSAKKAAIERGATAIGDTFIRRTEMVPLLDHEVIKDVRIAKAKQTKPMQRATKKLIEMVNNPALINAYNDRDAIDRLVVLKELIELMPVIDMFDQTPRNAGNPVKDIEDRYSQSGQKPNSILSIASIAKVFTDLDFKLTAKVNSQPIVWAGTGTVDAKKKLLKKYAATFTAPTKWVFTGKGADEAKALSGTVKAVYDISIPILSFAAMQLKDFADDKANLAAVEAIITRMLPIEADLSKATPGTIAIDFKEVLSQAEQDEFGKSMQQIKATQFAVALKALSVFDALYGFAKSTAGDALTAEEKRAKFRDAAKAILVVLDAAVDVLGKALGKTVIAGALGAVIAIPLLALDADAAYAGIDAASRIGDTSIIVGETLKLAGATTLAVAGVMGVYGTFAASATGVAGPVGLFVAVVVGIILVIAGALVIAFTGDKPMVTFAKNCMFGLNPNDGGNDPTLANFAFGNADSPNQDVQIKRLFELMNPLGLIYDDRFKTLSVAYNKKSTPEIPTIAKATIGWSSPAQMDPGTLKDIPETTATDFDAGEFWNGQTFLETIPQNMKGGFIEARVTLPGNTGVMRNWIKVP